MKFNTNQTYSTKLGSTTIHYRVTKRTDKSVWLQQLSHLGKDEGSVSRFSISISSHDGIETVYPMGKFSLCPVLKADKENRLPSQEAIALQEEYRDASDRLREYEEIARALMSLFSGDDLLARMADLDSEYGIDLLQKRVKKLKGKISA